MKTNHILIGLIFSIGTAYAQYQNYDLKNTDSNTESHTYVGRDYVRLLPGYSFKAENAGKTMNAKVDAKLTDAQAKEFLNIPATSTTTADEVTAINTSTYAVGEIPITSSVSPTGAKCYNVPIEIVPGRMGFQPNISLSYNSQAGNGLLGMGWSISGLSSIERVNKNMFFDGENDIPAFANYDAFALDGIRLIKVSSTSTTINYETVSNNIKVTAYISGDYFQYFKVLYPNGVVSIYGYENGQDYLPLLKLGGDIDNSGTHTSKPTWLSYPITKSWDINGNIVNYKYAIGVSVDGLDSGFLMPYYIYEISYGKNGSIDDFAKISFEYKDRADIILYQQCGYFSALRNLLSNIKVFVGTNNIRTYQLDYFNKDPRLSMTDRENRFDVNRLIQINCSAGSETLNSLKFRYGASNNVLTVEKDLSTLGSSGFDMKKIHFFSGKLDANLRNDALLVYPKKNVYQKETDGSYSYLYPDNDKINIYTDLSSSNSSPDIITTGSGFADIFTAKIGNSLTDKIVKINTGLVIRTDIRPIVQENIIFNIYGVSAGAVSKDRSCSVSVSPTEFFDSNGSLHNSITPRKNFTGNFTGNGNVEILSIPLDLTDDSNIHYNKKSYIFNLGITANILYNGDFIQKNKSDSIYALDLDGDGQTEIACITSAGTDFYKYSTSAGFSKYGHIALSLNDIQYRQMFFFDLNNDGKTDILLSPLYNSREWKIYYSDGKQRFFSIPRDFSVTTDQKYYIRDVDDDNIPELIVNNKNNLVLYPFNNNTYFPFFDVTHPIALGAIPKNSEVLYFDINSSSKDYQVLVLDSVEVSKISFSQSHGLNNQITTMINSLGVADKTTYDQLYQGANYTPGTAAIFPNVDFQGPIWVATQSSAMHNKQLIGNTTYKYAGAILHKQGLGFRGFSSITATDLMTNKKATTVFDPYKMGAVTSQVSEAQEAAFDYTFTDFDRSAGGNKNMKLQLDNKTVTDKLKGNTLTVDYSLYDSYGNAGKEVTSFGNGISTTIESTYQNVVTADRMLIGLPTNKKITNVRDNKSFIQSEGYVYNSDNRLQYLRKYIGSDSKFVSETEYEYNAGYGTLSKETVRNKITNNENDNLVTSYLYKDEDKCSLWKKTDPMGLTTEYSYDFAKRLLTGVKDYLGNTVTYGYDAFRRKNYELRPDGTSTSMKWEWANDSDPQRLVKQTATSTGRPTTVGYADALGRETRRTVTGLDGSLVYADKTYDNFGRLKGSTAPYAEGGAQLWTTYSYDQYNRPQKVMQPNGSCTTYAYDHNSITETKDGVAVTSTTDATGKTISSTDPGGTVTYSYRPDGQPDKTNAGGVETSMEYDDYGRQTKLVDPSAGTVQTDYDDANHKTIQTWNSGKSITTASNKFGQPTSTIAKDLVNPDITTTYGYDPTYGRPTGSSSTNGTSKGMEYDAYGRVWKQTETVNGKTYQEVYDYDQGQVGGVTYNTNPGANALSYKVVNKYKNGYLYRLEDAGGNRLWEINSANALGQATNLLLGNGLTTTKNYTAEGLVSRIQTGAIQDISFDFNRVNGTLNSRTDNRHGLSESFTYDNQYRLKSYGPPAYRATLEYLADGSISQKTDAGNYAYELPAKPYQLTKVSGIPLVSTGLATQQDITSTLYSRPSTISKPGGSLTASFQYNDAYDRTYMGLSSNSQTVWSKSYFAGGKYEIEPSANGDIQRIYLDGSPYTASVVLEKTGSGTPQLYYLHRDYLGSVTQVSDNFGNLAAEYSYDAWGRMRDVTNWRPYDQGMQPALKFGRGYTGHEHLNQFGLINMNARLYDPVLGRFLEPDPLVNSGMSNDFNRYVYCRDNPMMYTDMNGMSFKDWWKKNIADPFMREFHHVFGNGQGGWEIGYNSSGGFFTNPTYSGNSWGPSAGISNSGQITMGNSQGGFHNMVSTKPRIDPIKMATYQANIELKQIRYNQEQWKSEISNTLSRISSEASNFIENRYKTWGDFIYSPEVGYGFTYLSKGLKLPKFVNVTYDFTSYAYPSYKYLDSYNSYDQNYINYYSKSEAIYDFGGTVVSSIVTSIYGPEAGFATSIGFEVTKSGYKYVYHETEQRVIPYMAKFHQDLINICNPEFWVNPSAFGN